MSNEKYTPAPWTVKRVLTPEYDDDPLGAYIIEEAQDKLSLLYFEADTEDEALRTEQLDAIYKENNANMRLIAAAPDLLKALIKLVQVCQLDDIKPHVKGHLELAEKAIKKAEG